MKYRTFRSIVFGSLFILIVVLFLFTYPSGSSDLPREKREKAQNIEKTAGRPEMILETEMIRQKLDQWLADNPRTLDKTKIDDILPGESFRATVIRFPEKDAVKWSNDSRQWSQIRIDLNRDGKDDEKWLLKNGRTYKREVLDENGRVLKTYYFDR